MRQLMKLAPMKKINTFPKPTPKRVAAAAPSSPPPGGPGGPGGSGDDIDKILKTPLTDEMLEKCRKYSNNLKDQFKNFLNNYKK